jgi:hypothetical protein
MAIKYDLYNNIEDICVCTDFEMLKVKETIIIIIIIIIFGTQGLTLRDSFFK